MGELFTPTHLAVISVVAIMLFGAKRIPELGRGIGQGLRGFKDGLKGISDEMRASAEASSSQDIRSEQ